MEGENFNQPPAEKPKGGEEEKKITKMKIICAWCKKVMGEKEVESANEEETHSICEECKAKMKEEIEEQKREKEKK